MKIVLFLSTALLFSCGNAQEEKQNKNENKKTETKKTETENKEAAEEKTAAGFSTVSVDDFEKFMQSPCTVLDVRTPEEVAEGVIENAVVMNINDVDFAEKIKTLDKTIPVCVYCRSGGRSARAAAMLIELGYSVFNLDGGITAWLAEGKTVTKP